MITYGFTKILSIPFEKTIESVTEALKNEGFGILTKIDVKEKFKEKLNIDFKQYVILGACSPAHAYRAILAEENIGLMLPCNVVVYQQENNTVLTVIKPTAAMSMIDNDELKQIALVVEEKLKKAFDAVQ